MIGGFVALKGHFGQKSFQEFFYKSFPKTALPNPQTHRRENIHFSFLIPLLAGHGWSSRG